MSQPREASDLITAARHAEPGAIDRLLTVYRSYLALLAEVWSQRYPNGKADPSDLVQETLLKAQQNFGQFRGQTEPELAAWLRRILARNVADLVRRYRAGARRVDAERSLEQMLQNSAQAVDGLLAANGTTPSQAAQRRELGVVLAEVLDALSLDHRRVIVLRNLQELEWDEVARAMDRSVAAVQMLWTRALRELRPRIEKRL